jgi:hypothetical protein
MRALFGMVVTGTVGVIVSFMTQPRKTAEIVGLTVDTLDEGMALYKGGTPNHSLGEKARKLPVVIDESIPERVICLSPDTMKTLSAEEGDIVYIADSRWYLGGLRADHVKAGPVHDRADSAVVMSSQTWQDAYLKDGRTVTLEKIF